jgi:amidase
MKAAGVVAVGKTNVPEFGAGSHTFNPVYGTTVNPFGNNRSAGGSSGGAAVALATGMVSIADGSDMGGSLRNPAAWNNVVGFRSSPGLVPRIEPGPARATLAVEGAMGRTVDDVALLLSVIGAPDARDPLNRGERIPATVTPLDRPLRVAYSPTLGGLPVETAVSDVVSAFVGALGGLGWEVELAEPDFEGADECFATLRSFLFSTGPLGSLSVEQRSRLKATVLEEFDRGMALTVPEVARAEGTLKQLWQRSVAFFDRYDLMVGPVTQLSPFPADQEYPTSVAGQPCERYIDWMRSVCRVTVLGLPALSLPAGFDESGLPVGVQLIGGPNTDAFVLRAAKTAAEVGPGR